MKAHTSDCAKHLPATAASFFRFYSTKPNTLARILQRTLNTQATQHSFEASMSSAKRQWTVGESSQRSCSGVGAESSVVVLWFVHVSFMLCVNGRWGNTGHSVKGSGCITALADVVASCVPATRAVVETAVPVR